MKTYLLLFRNDLNGLKPGTPEEMQARTKKWMDWVGGIAAQNKLADRGSRLSTTGNVVKPGKVITGGPFREVKESVSGYSAISAGSLDEATEFALGCPIFESGGSVEVREIDVL